MSFITTSFLVLICILLNFHQFLKAEKLDVYIVHVDPSHSDDLDTFYDSFLPTITNVAAGSTNSTTDRPRILHRYRHVFSGFAAKLSAADVEAMRLKKGFVSARPERVLRLLTTRSPSFLGLNQNTGLWKKSNYGKGIIIGMVDIGVEPSHPSFGDAGMPPPPAKWKGECQFRAGKGACNNKLIGARFLVPEISPLTNNLGHGTHTSGTAAGNFVAGAAFFGNANGTASGVAPLAHLAVYQVCNDSGCPDSAIAAAIDAAIDDGVDILSISLGGQDHPRFADDVLAVGAYRAMERGIIVSAAAGNAGSSSSVTNEAPWFMTVGASTTDRRITVTAVLGNGEQIDGETGKGFPSIEKLELVYPGACFGQLDPNIRGKIVVCDNFLVDGIVSGKAVKAYGGAAVIILNSINQGETIFETPNVLPAMQVSYVDGRKIIDYSVSTPNATAALLFKGDVIGNNQAPVVGQFSSRGPSQATPGILKPDIIGPGINILAAWPISVENQTNTKSTWNIISGTSMSCPHLSGVAALLKSAHPDWSPAAIKSAIMTTADQVNIKGNPIEDEKLHAADVFAIGSGHVNPTRANDPGLVYDISPDDYIPYLCGLNYTNQEVGIIVGRKVDCAKANSFTEDRLNYPSFSIVLKGSTNQIYTATRTLTNVGKPNSSYRVEIGSAADGVIVNVDPEELFFQNLGDKLSYRVIVSRSTSTKVTNTITQTQSQGFITWTSADYSVRSPIAFVF
ncbi:hypothetical protein ABFS82_05G071000 [Erythranthe guttata]|uniref:Peptidase S8/S53 domain-containing protein n=1 Tax=Erythranthe guttata TaxID=4155 RepID=A0A022R1H8_ERYGU|nr:PREDICTED: subtilisin-like protease SBT1.2 [Erythranthe guttata]EYU33438.1 hypothetical protein MIMGU_mgv1a026511mg [Erythranthe guttata]|eukprot:XP_012842188.1 PREDICTED: subtilisin-like protease SBT1.2 [Erythranthe guttata]